MGKQKALEKTIRRLRRELKKERDGLLEASEVLNGVGYEYCDTGGWFDVEEGCEHCAFSDDEEDSTDD